ncbi:MAG: hypothetical protein J7L94_06325 [Caldisericaceae bacterium]|nr:hypothetical protein [Caldisericaceae bacterium]
MKSFKLLDEFKVSGHQFQIITELKKTEVESAVSEAGKLLYQKWYSLKPDLLKDHEQHWKDQAYQLHEQIVDEIETIFNIKEKIANVTQPNYRYRFGRVLFSFNFIKEAIEEFKTAIELKSDYIKAYRKLAACYMKEHEYALAADTLKKALNMTSPFPDILNDLGVAYTFMNDYEKARDCFVKAQEMKPDFLEANFHLGLLLLLSSFEEEPDQKLVIPVRLIRSLKALKNASYIKDDLWKERVEFVLDKIKENKLDGIIANLIDLQMKLITRDDPVLVKFDLFFLKFMYGKKKMEEESIEFYESWLMENIQNFKYADYWNDIGVIHLIQCRNYFLNALEEIERAYQLNPHFTEASENLEKIKRIKNGFLILLRALLKN